MRGLSVPGRWLEEWAGDLGECIWKVRGPGDGVIPGLGGGGRDYSCRYRYRKLQLELGLQP